MEPTHIGTPMNRDRGYHWGTRRDYFLEGDADDFMAWSKRTLEMEGDDLVVASEGQKMKLATALASSRHMLPPETCPACLVDWVRYLPMGSYERFREWEQRGKKK
eukprot:4050703-Alexandrium_andersonii.AAC.1